MLEDTSFSVTESYLKSLGVNIANYSEVQDMIYLLGGSKYKIDINYDVFVRCPDMPSVCRKDNVYVSAAFKGMRAGVAAVIADTVVSMGAPYFRKDKLLYLCIMVGAFFAAWFFDINVAFIILACGVLGIIIGAVQRRRGKA